MKILLAVCTVVAACGWSESSPRHRDVPIDPHEWTVKEVAKSWEHPQDEEHVRHLPQRFNVRHPSHDTPDKTHNVGITSSPLLLNKSDDEVKATNSLQHVDTPSHTDDDAHSTDRKGKLLAKHKSHEITSSVADTTAHASSSIHKRKNIFQLIKHLELALDMRRRKDRLKLSEEKSSESNIQHILKKPTHNAIPTKSDTHFKKHNHEKSNKHGSKQHSGETELKNLLKNNYNRKHTHSVHSGRIHKIGNSQQSEDDWINIATKEIKTDLSDAMYNKISQEYNSNDNSFIKSVESEIDLTEHAIASIIKQLREILADDLTDSATKNADQNKDFMKSNSVSHAIENSPTVNIHKSQSSSKLTPNSSSNASVLIVHSGNLEKSSSVESESAMSSSQSVDVLIKPNSAYHTSIDESSASSYLSQSKESYSDQHRSKDDVSASYQSISQGLSSVQDESSGDSTTSSIPSQSNESSTTIYENISDDEDENMYNKYEKILAEKAKNDSLLINNKVNISVVSSNEISNALPLSTTAVPILNVQVTETTESANMIDTHQSTESSDHVLYYTSEPTDQVINAIDSNEIDNITKPYRVLPSVAMLNYTRNLLSTNDIPDVTSIPSDVTAALTNILLAENDLDLSTPEQHAIDTFLEEIAQELAETVEFVTETSTEGFPQKIPSYKKNNGLRNRHDRTTKTYNLAFHFNK